MHTIQLTDEQYAWVKGFRPVAEAVMNEPITETDALCILIQRGLEAGLGDVIAPTGEATNTKALLQLAALRPIEVGGFIADRISLGADLRSAESRRHRIGL